MAEDEIQKGDIFFVVDKKEGAVKGQTVER